MVTYLGACFLSLGDRKRYCVGPLAVSVNIVENCFPAQYQSIQSEPCLNDGRCIPLGTSSVSLIVVWWRTVDASTLPSLWPLSVPWRSYTTKILYLLSNIFRHM